jgi:hypothetical protein
VTQQNNIAEVSVTFPDEWKIQFEGLLYLGYLSKEVTSIPFHHFVVRTLTVAEKLEVSLLTKEYVDTIGYGRAYRAAIVAAGLQYVDGRELLPATTGTKVLRQKFDYVVNGWYDSVIDILYKEIDDLEGQVLRVLQELGIFKVNSDVTPIFKDEEDTNDSPKDGR